MDYLWFAIKLIFAGYLIAGFAIFMKFQGLHGEEHEDKFTAKDFTHAIYIILLWPIYLIRKK